VDACAVLHLSLRPGFQEVCVRMLLKDQFNTNRTIFFETDEGMKAPPFNGRALIPLTSENRVRTRRQQQHVRISTVAVTYHTKLCAHRSEGKREGRGRERYGGRERETGRRATDEREIQEERVRAKKTRKR
jgi:hypothetical protein